MDWQIDPRRQVYVHRLTDTISEVIGRFTSPSDSSLPSLPTILPIIDLFERFGQTDAEFAPSCLRITESKTRKIQREIWDWAVSQGLIVAIERKGTVIAYRTNEAWHDWMMKHATQKNPEPGIEWSNLDLVFAQHGRLGLRIASQLAFGNTHVLDNIKIPDPQRANIQVWRDAVPSGANVVRLGGCLSIQTPHTTYSNRWTPPGHFLWSWDVEEILPSSLVVGSRILIIENPYAYWHMLQHLAKQDWTLICLHGETRQPGFLGEDADLYRILKLMAECAPHALFEIWCDPDPGGLVMATNAMEIIQRIGGKASFRMMDDQVLNRIETLVIAQQKLLPLDGNDISILQAGSIHNDLKPLANEITRRQQKGEQECLSLVFQTS